MKQYIFFMIQLFLVFTAHAQQETSPRMQLACSQAPASFLEPALLSFEVINQTGADICLLGEETLVFVEIKLESDKEWQRCNSLGLQLNGMLQTEYLGAGDTMRLSMRAPFCSLLSPDDLKAARSRQFQARIALQYCDRKTVWYSPVVSLIIAPYSKNDMAALDFALRNNLSCSLNSLDNFMLPEEFRSIQELIRRFPGSILAQYAKGKLVYRYHVLHYRNPELDAATVQAYQQELVGSRSPFITGNMDYVAQVIAKNKH